MNRMTVAHHRSLPDLPPGLGEAFKSGRCTSPRTRHELGKLQDQQPQQVHGPLASGAAITRAAVSALRAEPQDGAASRATRSPSNKLIAQANTA